MNNVIISRVPELPNPPVVIQDVRASQVADILSTIEGRMLPQPGDIWRHYKGHLYEIISNQGMIEATVDRSIIYRRLNPKMEPGNEEACIWIRPVSDFMSKILWTDKEEGGGKFVDVYRFTLFAQTQDNAQIVKHYIDLQNAAHIPTAMTNQG